MTCMDVRDALRIVLTVSNLMVIQIISYKDYSLNQMDILWLR